MAFKDVLHFLYERAKEQHGVANQDQFARRHGISREHMNQFLTGNEIPPSKTIWEILEREGYKLSDCIELPDTKTARLEHTELYDDLDVIVTSGDTDRIHGIGVNLYDIAEGARSGKKRKRQSGLVVQRVAGITEAGQQNLAPNEKKKVSRKKRGA